MNRTKPKRKTTSRPLAFFGRSPNPWRAILAKDYPGVPFEEAVILYRRRLEKIVAEGMAKQALRKALRRERNKIAKSP
jgi:hypothetical protein